MNSKMSLLVLAVSLVASFALASDGIDGKTPITKGLNGQIGVKFLKNFELVQTAEVTYETHWKAIYRDGRSYSVAQFSAAGTLSTLYNHPGFCQIIVSVPKGELQLIVPTDYNSGKVTEIESTLNNKGEAEVSIRGVEAMSRQTFIINCRTTGAKQLWSISDVETHLNGIVEIGLVK